MDDADAGGGGGGGEGGDVVGIAGDDETASRWDAHGHDVGVDDVVAAAR